MKVYISGQISGLSQEVYTDRFGRAEAMLLNEGHDPVNPIKIQACHSEDCWDRYREAHGLPTSGGGAPFKEDGTTFLHHYACYMKYDIIALLECDAIAMLPGWDRSRGAQLELDVAKSCGLKQYIIRPDYTGVF